eukprot:4002573-Pyramimonas_sp.AAC.1
MSDIGDRGAASHHRFRKRNEEQVMLRDAHLQPTSHGLAPALAKRVDACPKGKEHHAPARPRSQRYGDINTHNEQRMQQT